MPSKPRRSNRPDRTDELLTDEERALEPPPIDSDDPIDEAAAESFPASDPPSFNAKPAEKSDKGRRRRDFE